jgi:hypothetical protein
MRRKPASNKEYPTHWVSQQAGTKGLKDSALKPNAGLEHLAVGIQIASGAPFGASANEAEGGH